MTQIDQRLKELFEKSELTVTVHSSFKKAVNLQTEGNMITILSSEKCLQPMSIRCDAKMNFENYPWGFGEFLLSKEGLRGAGEWILRFSRMVPCNLRKEAAVLTREDADQIRTFLSTKEPTGIHGLLEKRADNVYAEFLEPRIAEFRTAVSGNNLREIGMAVDRLAGCGPGLTPSSDDYLCGYVSAFPDAEPYKSIRNTAVDQAVKKTNDISASLLRNAGNGYFSMDILELYTAFVEEDADKIRDALEKVASFGSSSGCDFLTGMHDGIFDISMSSKS